MTGTWQSKPLPSLYHSFLIPLMLEPLQSCSGSNDIPLMSDITVS